MLFFDGKHAVSHCEITCNLSIINHFVRFLNMYTSEQFQLCTRENNCALRFFAVSHQRSSGEKVIPLSERVKVLVQSCISISHGSPFGGVLKPDDEDLHVIARRLSIEATKSTSCESVATHPYV